MLGSHVQDRKLAIRLFTIGAFRKCTTLSRVCFALCCKSGVSISDFGGENKKFLILTKTDLRDKLNISLFTLSRRATNG
jgi:hypothetical protein